MLEANLIQELLQFGLSGLILYIIVRPIQLWFMKRADEKDTQIRELIERHFVHDEERHQNLIFVLQELPEKLVHSITSIYDPTTYKERDKAYKKSLEE